MIRCRGQELTRISASVALSPDKFEDIATVCNPLLSQKDEISRANFLNTKRRGRVEGTLEERGEKCTVLMGARI